MTSGDRKTLASGWVTLSLVLLSSGPFAGCGKRSNPSEATAARVRAVTGGDTISAADLQLQVLANSCGANQAQDFFKIINSGTTPIAASDLVVKLWIDDTSGRAVVPHVWTGGCLTNASGCFHQVSGVTVTATPFSPACGPDDNHQANWEITIANSDPTLIAPNVAWSNLQSALNLADYSNFTPGESRWYSPCVPGSTYVPDSHFALYYKGNLVLSPSGINSPTCRSPHGQQPLSGYVTSEITSAPLVGPLPLTDLIDLAVGLPVRDPQGLRAKALDVSDPKSASYRQYLTLAQVVATYSPADTDYQAIRDWAAANGLTVTATFANKLLVDVRGTAAQIERALFANLQQRRRPDGSVFYALDREPSINVAPTVLRISGLDNRVLGTPGAGVGPVTSGAGAGPGGLYISSDFRSAYASCSAQNGAGQTVGLFELDGFLGSDITGYECQTGLATCNPAGAIVAGAVPNVQTVLVDGYNGAVASASGQAEVTIDIQMAVAMAPGLTGVTVYEANNDGNVAHNNNILNQMAANTGISQFSSSWFFGTDANTQPILNTLAVQGQSFFQCSGDQGSSSWTTDPGDIRDLEGVTVVGGTALTMTGTPTVYQSETTWDITGGGAGGGGIAANTVSPLYQAPFSNAIGGAALGKRLLPDVAMVATSEYGFLNGAGAGFIGTSLAAPLWAAYVALANQQSVSLGKGTAGFLNPFLYDVANAAPVIYNASYNDINDNSTNAGNCPGGVASSVCAAPGWNASAPGGNFTTTAGYDMAVGLGTPKCFLLNEIGTSSINTPPPDGGAGGPPAPSISVVATEGFRGVEFCMQGGGFTPGHAIQFKYLDLPAGQPGRNEVQAPLIVGSDGKYTNFDPTFGGGAESTQGFISGCSASDLTRSMTVQVIDVGDSSLVATASISNTWICGAQPRQNEFNETPLPDPPVFGTRTCPLPPN